MLWQGGRSGDCEKGGRVRGIVAPAAPLARLRANSDGIRENDCSPQSGPQHLVARMDGGGTPPPHFFDKQNEQFGFPPSPPLGGGPGVRGMHANAARA